MNKTNKSNHGASFRDPSGFIFWDNGKLIRQINKSYADNYELLMSSGLYDKLIGKELLIPHQELDNASDKSYKQILPKIIPFISYPYEWTFGQLKDAALATLAIQKISMKYGMSLKDASAFNIQFWKGKPVLIDSLSFEKLNKTKPWIAYRQFCQHFLAPLAIASHQDIRAIQMLRTHIDGIPLDLASKLLSKTTWANPSLLMHLHFHASSQAKYASRKIDRKAHSMNKYALEGMISSLIKAIEKLHWKKKDTEWGEYYSFTNYSQKAFNRKKMIIEKYFDQLPTQPEQVWDLGANTGLFSRVASNKNIFTVSFDVDYSAVEQNYQQTKKEKERKILPLFLDLTNPSTDLGWAHQERESLETRSPADLAFALALIHHISISNNVPFGRVAQYFSRLCKHLIIEFVPKNDSNAQKLLLMREDIFDKYDQENFEKEFSRYFKIIDKSSITNSERFLYLMRSFEHEN